MTIVVYTAATSDPTPYIFETAHADPAVLWLEALPKGADTIGYGPWDGNRGLIEHHGTTYIGHRDYLDAMDATDPLWPVIDLAMATSKPTRHVRRTT